MRRCATHWVLFAGLAAVCAAAAVVGAPSGDAHEIRAGLLRYAGGKHATCFAGTFLRIVAYKAGMDVASEFELVDAESEALFEYPFVVMSGEGSFELSDAELRRLREYAQGGGFLLVSAGCSNKEWAASAETALDRMFPGSPRKALPEDHPALRSLFTIHDFSTTQQDRATLYGVELDGRLAVVYSPDGLNDTGNATRIESVSSSKGCCCCPGNELRKSLYINANLLVYAMLR